MTCDSSCTRQLVHHQPHHSTADMRAMLARRAGEVGRGTYSQRLLLLLLTPNLPATGRPCGQQNSL